MGEIPNREGEENFLNEEESRIAAEAEEEVRNNIKDMGLIGSEKEEGLKDAQESGELAVEVARWEKQLDKVSSMFGIESKDVKDYIYFKASGFGKIEYWASSLSSNEVLGKELRKELQRFKELEKRVFPETENRGEAQEKRALIELLARKEGQMHSAIKSKEGKKLAQDIDKLAEVPGQLRLG